MPTILRKSKKRTNDGLRKERMAIYNTAHWRKLRDYKLRISPLCEMCLKEGRTTAAEEVHHIVSFMETTNQDVRIQLAFDDENLMSVCKVCHQKMHNSK